MGLPRRQSWIRARCGILVAWDRFTRRLDRRPAQFFARRHCAPGEPGGHRGTVKYLNSAALDARAFRLQQPYPWIAPAGLLSDEGFRSLEAGLPPLSRFTRVFGKQRKHGQKPHDRYALEWEPDLELHESWREFIDELRGQAYRDFRHRMLGVAVRLRLHWHFTPRGCAVSPHCDGRQSSARTSSTSILPTPGNPPGEARRLSSTITASFTASRISTSTCRLRRGLRGRRQQQLHFPAQRKLLARGTRGRGSGRSLPQSVHRRVREGRPRSAPVEPSGLGTSRRRVARLPGRGAMSSARLRKSRPVTMHRDPKCPAASSSIVEKSRLLPSTPERLHRFWWLMRYAVPVSCPNHAADVDLTSWPRAKSSVLSPPAVAARASRSRTSGSLLASPWRRTRFGPPRLQNT